MIARAVPIIATFADGTQVGTDPLTPAVLHIHDSSHATITASRTVGGGPELYEAFVGKLTTAALQNARNMPWGVIPLDLATEAGTVRISRGPGCACGHPVKHFTPLDPGVQWIDPPPPPAQVAAGTRPPVPTTAPQVEF